MFSFRWQPTAASGVFLLPPVPLGACGFDPASGTVQSYGFRGWLFQVPIPIVPLFGYGARMRHA